MHLWAEDGTLLATASQSAIVRLLDADMAIAMAEAAQTEAASEGTPDEPS